MLAPRCQIVSVSIENPDFSRHNRGLAPVVKLVDTSDLKSAASVIGACRFDSGPGHHQRVMP